MSQQLATGAEVDAAGRRFGECRAQAGEAIGTLLDSGALTPLGARFVQQMRDSLPCPHGPSEHGPERLNGQAAVPAGRRYPLVTSGNLLYHHFYLGALEWRMTFGLARGTGEAGGIGG